MNLRAQERREWVGYLRAAIAALPDRLRVMVEKYFLDDQTMADIADEIEVGESRISQLRAEPLVLLRHALISSLDPHLIKPVDRPTGIVDRRRAAYVAAVAAQSDFRTRLTALAEEAKAPSNTSRVIALRADATAVDTDY